MYFPNTYDIKIMISPLKYLHGGLSKLCKELGVSRTGTQHQAGSDSIVTAAAFFKIKEKFYNGKDALLGVTNSLYGINSKESWENYEYDKGFADWYDYIQNIMIHKGEFLYAS